LIHLKKARPASFCKGAIEAAGKVNWLVKTPASLRILDLEADAAQMNRMVLAGGLAIQRDGLVGNDASCPISRRGVDAVGIRFDLARVTKRQPDARRKGA
jgi:hypothetical protein